jgi:glycosyltransferase involved in cell wall biosynthesis
MLGKLLDLRRNMYDLLGEDEYKLIARKANRRHDIDCWLVSNPAWSTAARLKAPIVSFFPDFVFAEHRSGYPGKVVVDVRRRFAKLASVSPHYICFSAHVLEVHAKRHFGIPESCLHLIPHPSSNYTAGEDEQDARVVLRRYMQESFSLSSARSDIDRDIMFPFLSSLDLSRMRYLLVSTQLRPYKNVLRVAKAVCELIRRHHIDLKLIVTGTIDLSDKEHELSAFIRENGLYFDVISVPRVPKHVHRLLYRFAALAIHPSFFEGGFPFVFSEAVTNGTPCLLARSAVVKEVLNQREHEHFTFDPYIPADELAVKIKAALDTRSRLYAQQRLILDSTAGYTWHDAAAAYLGVLKQASAMQVAPTKLSRLGERSPA